MVAARGVGRRQARIAMCTTAGAKAPDHACRVRDVWVGLVCHLGPVPKTASQPRPPGCMHIVHEFALEMGASQVGMR